MCYNFRVKSKALITISLCSVLVGAGITAYGAPTFASGATSSATEYPDIFIDCVNDNLDGLIDFATDGKSYAFADKTGVVVVENEERTVYEIKNISALDSYAGTYYYQLGTVSYSLPLKTESDYDGFPSDYSRAILADGSDYIIHTDGKCYYRAYGELSYSPLEGDEGEQTCYKLKVYDGVAYALLGSGTSAKNDKTVKKLNGKSCESVNPTYIDFKGVTEVSIGTVKESLSSFNSEKLHFATLEHGSYYTQIDLENLSGSYFSVIDDDIDYGTYRCGYDGVITSDEIMLVLGESGNATVFTYGGNCYITLSKKLQQDDYTQNTSVEETNFQAYINAPDWIYSSPYICNATKTVELTALDTVKVVGKVSTKIVDRQFYKIEFGEGEDISTGYVLEEFLEAYPESETEHPDDKNFGVIKDDRYEDGDLVKIVVLLLIVIALVLIGLSYITYVLTSKKRRALKRAESQNGDGEQSELNDERED